MVDSDRACVLSPCPGRAIVPEDGVSLREGTTVTVIADAPEETFEVSAAEEERLVEAIAEVERGDVVHAADLLDRLPR